MWLVHMKSDVCSKFGYDFDIAVRFFCKLDTHKLKRQVVSLFF